jgi:hypothetical protein
MGNTLLKDLLDSLKEEEVYDYQDFDNIEDLRKYLFEYADTYSEKCNELFNYAIDIHPSLSKSTLTQRYFSFG